MAKHGLTTLGDRISVDKFHVSRANVNYGEPFGDSEEDKKLIANLRAGKKIVQPFKARPEKDGFGVYVGRRRFLGKKEAGFKIFVVGDDCLIKDVSAEEAEEASWTENIREFQKGMNCITRAKRLNRMVSRSPGGLRTTARRMGMPASTLSEYMTVLQLTERMRQVLAKGLVTFSDGLRMVRMKLGEALQDDLAELLESEGLEAFKKELARVAAGKERRGIPAGVYDIDRLVWDRRNRNEMDRLKIVDKAAEKKGMTRPEYEKDFIMRHIEEIEEEAK